MCEITLSCLEFSQSRITKVNPSITHAKCKQMQVKTIQKFNSLKSTCYQQILLGYLYHQFSLWNANLMTKNNFFSLTDYVLFHMKVHIKTHEQCLKLLYIEQNFKF